MVKYVIYNNELDEILKNFNTETHESEWLPDWSIDENGDYIKLEPYIFNNKRDAKNVANILLERGVVMEENKLEILRVEPRSIFKITETYLRNDIT